MKKLFLVVVAVTVLTSCFKQNPKPKNDFCSCGRVEEKKIVYSLDEPNEYLYTLTLRNRCTGNYKVFEVSKENYILAQEKKDFCVSGITRNGW